MRRSRNVDPDLLKREEDTAWYIDQIRPRQKPRNPDSSLATIARESVYLAVEERIYVEYSSPVLRTNYAFISTQIGADRLKYIEAMRNVSSGLSSEVIKVLNHPKTRLVTDRPVGLQAVTFDEAVLLTSWGNPVTVWTPERRPTFWARPEDMPALVTLRIIRTEEP